MSENTELLGQLEKLISWKKSKNFMADKLGISVEEVTQLLSELRGSKTIEDEAETAAYISELEDRVVEYNEEKGTFKSSVVSSFEPKSHEELAELHRVDISKYKISSYWSKQRGDKFTSSVLCTQIKPTDFQPEKFAEFLSTYMPPQYSYCVFDKGGVKEDVDVEFSIYDFHIDKLTIPSEPIEERVAQYKAALTDLVEKVTSVYNIGTAVFPISNDFFHTDSYQGTTTGGTPLDISSSWNDAYEIGFDLMVWAINYIAVASTNVEVILVAGNHDTTKSFYLAHALDVFFKDNPNIEFDRTFDRLKYTVLGNTFIGYHHGNCKSVDELPLMFATTPSSSVEFGLATHREIHTGDKHTYMAKETKGSNVRIIRVPSLSGEDKWHRDHGFINHVRAALVIAYHPVKGRIAEFEHRI